MPNKQQLREQVFHYYRTIAAGQNIIQSIKQLIFIHDKFNPILLFQKISRKKQRIVTQDWRYYLESINLTYNQRQLKYFLKHNLYKSQVTLNQFLESIIPFNGDVVRKYKDRCNSSIMINQRSEEIDKLFQQVIQNQFKLYRSLINIRQDITANATLRDIKQLVKEDLLDFLDRSNKPMERRKLKETFQAENFKLGYAELRKFYKDQVPERQMVHQFTILSIMRYFKGADPFAKIIFRGQAGERDSHSAKKRSRSIQNRQFYQKSPSKNNQQASNYLSKQKSSKKNTKKNTEMPSYRKDNENFNQYEYQGNQRNIHPIDNKNNYLAFKDNLIKEFSQPNIKNKQASYKNAPKREQANQRNFQTGNYSSSKKDRQNGKSINNDAKYRESNNRSQAREQHQSGSKYNNHLIQSNEREQGGILKNQKYVIKFFEQIITKQQQLQNLRKTLAKQQEFNLINLYKLIDHKYKGYITSKDLNQFDQSEKRPYIFLVNFYGRQNDKLKFHEFCQIFRPLSRQLNDAIDSRQESNIPDPFRKQTKKIIFQILKVTAQLHLNLYKLKQSMKILHPQTIFHIIDVYRKGYIDSQSFQRLFKQNNISYDDKSLKCLMKLFRKRVDQKIQFAQLQNFISV